MLPNGWGENVPWDQLQHREGVVGSVRLPTMEQLDQWYIKSLIEEMGDIREDLGLYRRLLKKAELSPENRALVKNLIELDKKRLGIIRAEIEELRNGQKTYERTTGRVSRAGQGSFQF